MSTSPAETNLVSKSLVTYSTKPGVAIITVDNPPVNALGPGVPEGLALLLDCAAADTKVHAVVIIGAGRTFIAGADIGVLQEMSWGNGPPGPLLRDLLSKIENLSKPVVMAIHGTAWVED